jgi:hypothetical protein
MVKSIDPKNENLQKEELSEFIFDIFTGWMK